MNNTSTNKSGESLGLWLLKIITGALVIVLLFVHLVVNHFSHLKVCCNLQ